LALIMDRIPKETASGSFVAVPAGSRAGRGPAEGGHRSASATLPAAALLGTILLLFGGRILAQYRPLTYLTGDCPYYALTAVSLLYDHDLDLRNQLRGGLEVHGKQIALGRDGAWYPKHPILMPIVAVPFILLFGLPGTLILNLLVLGALALALMRLAGQVAAPWPSAVAAFLLIAGSFLRAHVYAFSDDLFATLILVLGLVALVEGRDGAGGLLLGLGVAARLAHLLLLPFGVFYAFRCRGWPRGLRAIAGALGPLLAVAALNLAMFGSPLVTSYDRNIVHRGDALVMVSHRGLFGGSLVRGVAGELFDPVHGLLPTSPAIFLALPGLPLFWRRRPREALLYLALGEFLLLFFATYQYWSASPYGPRFLMPLVAIAAPPAALTLQWIQERVRVRTRGGAAAADASA